MMSRKRILIVEDNSINRAMLREILSSTYTVLEAEDGQQALDVLRSHKDEIALVLLDIMMPVMDGYTFLSIVKADPALASIPVIVTTQSDSESDEVTALSQGAADFVAKPYKPQIILHRVASIINLRESAAMINQFQYDQLTGLYSKEFFYQRARQLLIQHPEREYDIICSDVENFKLVNDVFGVPAGDQLLCRIAELYASQVNDQGVCSHLNADQFACLVERRFVYTDDTFVRAGLRINRLSNMKNVVMKWGIYPVEDRSVPIEQMCDRALLAARGIKGQYGRHFARYDDELRSKLLREQAITDGMETALAQGQFVVYLQPKYSLSENRLAGAEALVRWNHPKWGFMSPGEFIPLFEKNGFITKLDQFVWDKACVLLRQWEDWGYPEMPVSVNVSRADVYQADVADMLMKTVEKYALPPSRLHLEITESAYTENPEQIIKTVSNLRQLGFIIEMDDFGSGYSSLNMLNQMPLDILKLDMKFIQVETAKPLDQGILHFIMSLARWMNLSVVAEGVETEEQLERLRRIGCDYVQGYYFAKPMPQAEFERLLHEEQHKQRQQQIETQQELQKVQILLVVDEDEGYRQQVCSTFDSRFQVIQAADGKTAVSCIASYGQCLGAVLLSMTVAEKEGYSLLEVLQWEKSVWRIPVIATAPFDAQLEEKALELGVDDFIAKPHTQRSLSQRLDRVMGAILAQDRERILKDEACRDYLTGLLNRRGLDRAMRSIQPEETPIAVCVFDLDNLKRVNDNAGHSEGDRMLQRFGALLRQHTRGSDILGRFGGDEFVVVMKGMESEEIAVKKGEEICKSFQQEKMQDGSMAACSGGIAICRDAQVSIKDIFSKADAALYHAKAERKGGCRLWKET